MRNFDENPEGSKWRMAKVQDLYDWNGGLDEKKRQRIEGHG